jgi:hypothetical protein
MITTITCPLYRHQVDILKALLATPPAPHGTARSRKTVPKVPKKAKKKQRTRNAPMAPVGTYAHESAPVKGLRKRKRTQ